jgi:hypothetical protein
MHVDNKSIKIFKPYDVIDKSPSIVIIGNSRNYYSFSPQDTETTDTYNLSFPGIGVVQIRSLFEHIIRSEIDIREFIISLDSFCDPLSIRSMTNSLDDRVLISNDNSLIKTKINKVLLYLSLDASYTSYRNINKPDNNYLTTDGRAVWFNEFNYHEKGPGNALFKRESRNIIRRVNNSDKITATNYNDYKKQCQTNNLDFIIDSAITNNIKINFFLNPVNARYWEIYNSFNELETYVHFPKKLIKEKLKNIPGVYQHLFTGMDFLRLNTFTMEPLSYFDQKERNYWYESSHYKASFGNVLLLTILNKEFNNSNLVKDLKLVDLDLDYSNQITMLNQWRTSNSKLKEEISRSIDSIININPATKGFTFRAINMPLIKAHNKNAFTGRGSQR